MSIGRNPVVVSIHDVAPATLPEASELLRLCDRHGVRSTLLVIPGPWRCGDPVADAEFQRWLRTAADNGHEVSLHGWEHVAQPNSGVRERVVARGCGEFAVLAEHEAQRRIASGLQVMEQLGFGITGFTPPGWLASSGTLTAAKALGLSYVTTHRFVHDLTANYSIALPAVCQRPSSPLEPLAASVVRRYAVRRIARGLGIRIALHPADLSSAVLRESATALVQVASFARPVTYAELVGSRRLERPIGVAV